jgi:hypothetical protein
MDESDRQENLSTVGSGRVDTLFDELEVTVEQLSAFADELENLRRRIDANEGETSGHVRNRVTQDADQLAAEATDASERVADRLEALKRTV